MPDLAAEISAKLGLDVVQFKAALADADASVKAMGGSSAEGMDKLTAAVKHTHSAMREFRELVAAGGMIAAVQAFYTLAIDYADKQRNSTDENVLAVQRFGASLKEVTGLLGAGAVAILGPINKAGEAFGNMWNIASQGWGKWADGEAVLEKTKKDADAAVAALAESQKHAKEFEDATKRIAEAEKQLAAYEESKKTIQEQINDILAQIAAQTNIVNAAASTTLEKRQAEAALAELNLELIKKQADLEAQDEARKLEHQKQLNKAIHEAQEFGAKAALSMHDTLEMFTLQRKAAMGLTDAESQRLHLLQLQLDERQHLAQIEELEQQMIKNGLNAADQATLASLIQQDDTLKQQISDIQAVTAAAQGHLDVERQVTGEMKKQGDEQGLLSAFEYAQSGQSEYNFGGMKISGTAKTADYFSSLSQPVLEKLVSDYQKQIRSVQDYTAHDTSIADQASGFAEQAMAEDTLKTNAARAQYQLDQLKNLSGKSYGAALSGFGGDLGQFDSLYQKANQGKAADPATKTSANILKAIHGTLQKVFPDQAADVVDGAD